MGYNKLVAYGETIELYEYEKNLNILGRKSNRGTNRDCVSVLAPDGADSQLAKKAIKRQDNARRATVAFRRLVSANLGGIERPILVTLTYAENITSLRQGYEDFATFVQNARYKFGRAFRYIAVPEFQRRGAVHFHALFWGLPSETLEFERASRVVAGLWGKGYVYLKPTDGNDRLSGYLSKYMSKAFVEPQLANRKAYVCSKNIVRPIELKGFSPAWPVTDDWIGDLSPCKEKTFMTKWLGKGRYRLYKTSNN